MSRTRTALAAAVLAVGVLAPAALAEEPQCDKPVGVVLHEAHAAAEVVPVVGGDVSEELHDREGQYCASALPV